MTQKSEGLRLIDFHNRVADFKMKGTYGYSNPDFKGVMLTSESWVEELVVTNTRVFTDDGVRLDSPLIIGEDRYGRKMSLPIDRILAVNFLDTKEQARLKSTTFLIDCYGKVENLEETSIELYNMYMDCKKVEKELIDDGVELYQRK